MNSTEHEAKSPSTRAGRFATLRGPVGNRGSGARGRPRLLPLVALVGILGLLAFAGSAMAAVVHPLKETFGSATQPTFTNAQALAVDQSTGDLLVVDAGAKTLSRFKPNGDPAPFSSLGTNVIDAKKGPGGKPCGEEPASCDETPQNGFTFGVTVRSPREVQVAVDNSGGITNGDIYVTQIDEQLVDVFSSQGSYIGQLIGYEAERNDTQKLTFTGVEVGDEFTLGNLPASCTANSVTVTYERFNQGEAAILNALSEKCGSGNVGVAGWPPRVTVTFEGALGDINLGQLTCTAVTGTGSCSVATIQEGGFGLIPFAKPCGVAVDSGGHVIVSDYSNSKVLRFDPSHNPPLAADASVDITTPFRPCAVAAGSGTTAGSIFATQSGGDVYKLELSGGSVVNQFEVASGTTTTIAVDPGSGNLLVADGNVATEYDAAGTSAATAVSTLTAHSTIQGIMVGGEDVYVSRAGEANVEVFGPAVSTPTPKLFKASEVGATSATLNGSVLIEGSALEECVFEYDTAPYSLEQAPHGTAVPCGGAVPADSEAHPVSARATGLAPETTYYVRLVATNGGGSSEARGQAFTTGNIVTTEAATGLEPDGATLNGSVNPAGQSLAECKFEYGPTIAYGSAVPCEPTAAAIEADFASHHVTAALAGLAQNSSFHFRLVVKRGSTTLAGEDMTFTTRGTPLISDILSLGVEETASSLRAKINPNGSGTNYRFEWGPTTSYGHRLPLDFEPAIGSGTSPVTVVGSLSGLAPGTVYHFRVVATNASGTAVSSDQQFETLGTNGLPSGRQIELVSPPDKHPVGGVNKVTVNTSQDYFQPAEDGEAVMYPILNSLESSDAGGEVIFTAQRSADGWNSTQVSPPSLITPPEAGLVSDRTGVVRYMSPNLRCAVVESHNPLTADTPEVDIENGVYNLYRWDRATGTYTLITNRVPLDPTKRAGVGLFYNVGGSSEDCSRIFFRPVSYSFLHGASGLYEWDEGTLRDAGLRPDGSLATGVSTKHVGFAKNVVSPDGRFFFVADSDEGKDSGKAAVFARLNSSETIDASQSATAVASRGARYETASPDGSSVFFLANYGLAATSSAGPTSEDCTRGGVVLNEDACDIYRYDIASEELVDVSADANPADTGGAMAQGILAVSNDGSVVYLATRGQLIPGKGRTFTENQAGSGFANVYRWDEGELSYVGSLTKEDISNANKQTALITDPKSWNSQTTDSGAYLLFVSRDNITGTNPAEVAQAYLYTASSQTLNCISCPPIGQPVGAGPLGQVGERALVEYQIPSEGFGDYTPKSLSDDGRAIFTSEDALAPGAIAGQGSTELDEKNIYEWHDGQVSLLAAGKVQMRGMGGPDGRDVFIQAFDQLNRHDTDFAPDLYDFRIGGGFAEPPPAPEPCNAVTGGCQSVTSPPAALAPASASFSGPANPPVAKQKANKKRHKKSHRKHKRHKRGHQHRHKKSHRKSHKKKHKKGHMKTKRAANGNRGGAK